MATVVIFHSVLGARPGITDAAERLRHAGHMVRVVDQYDGRVFDDYDEAAAFLEELGGYQRLMADAVGTVADLPDGFLPLGFSNGAGMAEYVATQRRVSGAVLCAGALPLHYLGVPSWPGGVPVQVHEAVEDPWNEPGVTQSFLDSVRATGTQVDHFRYPGSGHLFTDPTLPAEYDAASAELLWSRVLEFCSRHGGQGAGVSASG